MRAALLSALFLLLPPAAIASPSLSTSGTSFVDPSGRVVILKGVNVAADFKIPPFTHPTSLEPLPGWGVNALRLLFNWEAYEPGPERYDESYLRRLDELVDQAAKLKLFVVLDIHQDAYSRFLKPGCGEGFPAWTVPAANRGEARASADCSPFWGLEMAVRPALHAAYRGLYAPGLVREGYMRLVGRLAEHFKTQPAVVGYDLLNEPWGDERTELAGFYEEAAGRLHKADPSAIVFVEPHVFPVSFGYADTRLPKPTYAPVAYATHYYDPLVLTLSRWSPRLKGLESRGLARMEATAKDWDAPLFIGEMGVTGAMADPGPFMEFQYAELAAAFASFAQYSYTPDWTPERKDAWNGEDSSIVDEKGRLKPMFPLVPYAEAIAGRPLSQKLGRDAAGALTLELRWDDSGKGLATEVYAPSPASRWNVEFDGAGLRCEGAPRLPLIACRSSAPGEKVLRLSEKK